MLRSALLRATLGLALVGSGLTAVTAGAAEDVLGPAAPVAALPAAPPLQLLSRERTGRMEELAFSTPYLDGPTRARVLLPTGYDRQPGRRWPVLLLLHGCCDTTPSTMGGFSAWTDKGDAEAITRPGQFVVVMPEAGGAGFYSDHHGLAGEGGPAWESYHLRQLLPWVDKTYRTAGTRDQRAVAGLSMGGFGAMSYAARHPDLFSWAESYSGAVDPTHEVEGTPVRAGTVDQGLTPLDLAAPQTVWGPWQTEEVRYRTHGPVDLLGNLRHTTVVLRTGNGRDAAGNRRDPLEEFCRDQTVALHERLARAGIDHVFDDYGAGTHSWDFWQRDLKLAIDPLNAHFASRRGVLPAGFAYTTAEERVDVADYRVVTDRGFMEFATLTASTGRLALSGSGVFTVTTAPRYAPGARYRVTTTRNGVVERDVLVADRSGRLSFTADTGKRSSGQQYRPGVTTQVGQVQVAVARA